MSTYWDMQEVSITNATGMPLSITKVGTLEHGEWDAYPAGPIPNGAVAQLAFRTRSMNAAEVGPGPGEVIYVLPDGTTLDITFDMIFAVGQTTWVAATAGGTRGSNYTVDIDCGEESWHGQGRRFHSTITVTASNLGPNSRICKATN